MKPEDYGLEKKHSQEYRDEEIVPEWRINLKALQFKKHLPHNKQPSTFRNKWKALLFVLLLTSLSVLPPLFIVHDRWMKQGMLINFSKDLWCKSDFLCSSMFQPYFAWIFIFLGILSIIMVLLAPKLLEKNLLILPAVHSNPPASAVRFHRLKLFIPLMVVVVTALAAEIISCINMKRIPGMELLAVLFLFLCAILAGEFDVKKAVIPLQIKTLVKKLPVYGLIIFSLAILILVLKEINSFEVHKKYYLFLLLVLSIVLVIWQRKKLPKTYWLFALALILYCYKMSSWKFAFIGDEYSFYFYPTQSISQLTFTQIAERFFSFKGVYEVHPFFSSLLTYLSMLAFGDGHFGWHFLNVLLMALTIPMCYDLFKDHLPQRIAFLAVIPLAFSHYLINFSKIGYNNLQGLFALCLILWAANQACQRRSFSAYFLLGIILGVPFYTFTLSIYAIPLAGLFLLLFDPPRSKSVWARYAFAALGLAMILIPIFFQPEFWTKTAGNTVFFQKGNGFVLTNEMTNRILHNLLYFPFAYLYNPLDGHFVKVSLIDPILAVFLPIGFLLFAMNFRRNRFSTFILIAYLFLMLIVALTNPYDGPPMTRMFLFLPFYFVFAALGLDWLTGVIAGNPVMTSGFHYGIVTMVMLCCGVLSMLQATWLLDQRTENYPVQSVILRLFQHDALAKPEERKTYLFLINKDFGFYFFETFQDVYSVPAEKDQLEQQLIDSPEIPEDVLARIKDEEDLVVILPYKLDKDLFDALQPVLQETGKSVCEVKGKTENIQYYQLWYSERYAYLCEEARSEE